jgi:hypothetical protein
MSKEPKDHPERADSGEDALRGEGFLSRWSRKKTAARGEQDGDAESSPETRAVEPGSDPGSNSQAPQETETGHVPENAPGDEDMTPIDELGDDSDYSGFFSARVSPDLRKKALRRLFQSPKFNIRDGLDDYDDDYTTFVPLGSTVTAEMRRRAEDLLRRQMAAAETDGGATPDTELGAGSSLTAGSDTPDEPDSGNSSDDPGVSDTEEEHKNEV